MRLPPGPERVALFVETAALIERAGLTTYVAAPLVEPSERWFPDEWTPDERGVERLARRVFGYAGLGDVELAVERADPDDPQAQDERALWLGSLDAGAVSLSVDPRYLDDPLGLTAMLARIAAGVVRERHDLVDSDLENEQRCLDVTTVYLGFGIITTNAAYRYRAGGEQRGYLAITRWSHSRLGALSPQAMAYLLAMQLSVRNVSSREVRTVTRQLETNQASYFKAAYAALRPGEAVRQLGLVDRQSRA